MSSALHLAACLLILSHVGIAEPLRWRGHQSSRDSPSLERADLGGRHTGAAQLAWPRRALLDAGDAPTAADPDVPAPPPPVDAQEPLVPEEPPVIPVPLPAPPDPPEVPEPPEAPEPAEPIEPPELPEPPEPIDPPEPLEPPEPVDPPEPLEPPEPVDPPEPLEPPEPIDPPEPLEPPEPIAPPDPLEPPGAVDPPEPVEPPEPIEPPPPPAEVPTDDPPTEDPPTEDPPVDPPVVEDPPVEDPPVEDPPAEDPPAEDPPTEDPPAGNPVDPPADPTTPDDPPPDDGPSPPDDSPSPSRNRDKSNDSSSSGSDNTVAIAVGVGVSAFVVIGVVVLLCCFCKRKKNRPSGGDDKTQPTYEQYNTTAQTGAMDPRYATAVAAGTAGMARSRSGKVKSRYPSDHTMYPSQMSSQAYSSMQSPMSSHPSKADGAHPASMWTDMSWTNTSDAPTQHSAHAFFIPPASAKFSASDFTHAANKYLTTRQARNVTVIGAMVDNYGTEDIPSWTATRMSAGSGASRSPSVVLEQQLDWLEKKAGGLVLRKYRLLGKAQRRQGGQGLVAFARDRFSEGTMYAIKFYFGTAAFARERDILENKGLNRAMPACHDIIDSEQDRYVPDTPQGPIVLPPMIITEKGESLNEYIRRKHPDFITCMQVIVQIAEKLHIMHDAGYVHRDLKPSNAIWLPSQNTWSLIDFGCTAKEGSEQNLSFSLLYAAPEVVTSFRNGINSMTVSKAVDVFAFGVMCFELLTRSPYYGADPNGVDVCNMLEGKEPMPHERMSAESERKLGALRQTILLMLSRNPEERCSIDEMLHRCQDLFGIATYDFE